MPPSQGKLRRTVDLRIVSFALSVLRDNPDNQELAVAARFLASASLQLAGGYRALVETCKATASSEAIRKSMEHAEARRCEVLFEALAESLEEHRKGFQELIELVVVLAGETMNEEDQHGLNIWANSLGLSTDPLIMHDDDEDEIPVVEPEDSIARREHKPRRRGTREAYREERFEDLVSEAVARGIQHTQPKIAGSRVRLWGKHPVQGMVHLRWLRCPIAEAQQISENLNKELDSMTRTEPS